MQDKQLFILLILLCILIFTPSAECQQDKFEFPEDVFKKVPPEGAIITYINACCHYTAEIPYIRITFQFPQGARGFDLFPSDDPVASSRLKDYNVFEFRFMDLDSVELFNDIEINYTNTFFVLEFVSKRNKNYLLLSKNVKITDRQVRQFVINKIFIDLFTIIDMFDIIDVMQVVEYHQAKQDTVYLEKLVPDTVYMDTLFLEKIVQEKVYVTVDQDEAIELTDTVFVEKLVHDTVHVETVKRDTVFVDKYTDKRVFIEWDYLGSVPIKEKVVFANNGDYNSDLKYILNHKFSSWVDDPYLIVEFIFETGVKDLEIKKMDYKPRDIPEGYTVEYVIYPVKGSQLNLLPNCDYVKLHRDIALKLEDNKCSLLTKRGIKLKPNVFKIKDEKTVTIRINY